MQAEIIGVGTELLLGHTVNTDAAFLARELAALGVDLCHTSVVGDNPGRLAEELGRALSRSDVVITTGGLGPTDDDLTKSTAAAVLGKKLVLHEDIAAGLRDFFQGRDMGPNQLSQARFPEGAVILPNPRGTAPGCAVPTENGGLVVLLPGPPGELEPMFRDSVLPLLRARTSACLVSRIVRTFGQGEGDAALRLRDLCAGSNPTVATYLGPHAEVYVRVTAKAATESQAAAMADATVGEVRRILGDAVYGVDVPGLEDMVVRELTARGLEVATAESCTGGLLAKRITDIPGSSAVFRTGLVTYANETKTKLLGVPEDLLARKGAVSPEVARAMAEGVRKLSGADFGIGITGVAGPGGGSREKPVGLVWIALSTEEECFLRRLQPLGSNPPRSRVRERSAGCALDMLRRKLAGLPVVPEGQEKRLC